MIEFVCDRLALLFEFLSFGYIPVDNGQNGPAVEQMAGNGRLTDKLVSILSKTPDFTLATHEPVRIAETQSKGSHLACVVDPVSRRKENADVLADYLGRGVAKGAFGSGIEQQDAPTLIGADYRVGNEREDIKSRQA